MSNILCTLQGADIRQDGPDNRNRVFFTADGDSDADGANGQTMDARGKPIFAYAPGDKGADLLRNAGYPNGSYRDILVCGENEKPIVFAGGGYYSKTAYFRKGKAWDDPNRYLDSASVPFIVVEDFIRKRAKGIVLGCQAKLTNTRNGKSVFCVVGDIGPLYKIGESSMVALEQIGINSNPRTGGEEKRILLYEFWPDVPAKVNGEQFELIARAA